MSKVFRINVPAFGLSWSTHPENSASNVLLLPGGGGSTRSGVKNQIIIASLSGDKIDFKQSHLTDTEKRSSLCSGINLGFVEEKSIAAALVDQFCIIYSVKDDAGGLKFTTLTEFEGDFNKEDPCLNVVLVTSTGLIVTGGDDGILRIWAIKVHDNNATVVKLHELQKHIGAISAVHEHPSNPWIVSAGKDGRAIIWDYESGACLSEIPALIDGILDPKKVNLVITKIECRGCCFSPLDPNVLYTIQAAKMKATSTYLIKWQITNIVKASNDNVKEDEAHVASIQYTPKKKIEVVKSPSIRLSMSDDGKFLAVGSSNCSVTVLDAASLKKIRFFMHHDLPVTGLSFAPAYLAVKEGLQTMLASCSADNKLVIMRIPKSSGVLMSMLALLLVLLAVFALMYFSIDFMNLYHRKMT